MSEVNNAQVQIPQDEQFTHLLNDWVLNQSLESANKLRCIVFIHLKGMVSKQLASQAKKQRAANNGLELLPSATTLLQEVIVKLTPPKELYQSRQEFLVEFATFIRWVLLDELKKQQAQKRTPNDSAISAFLVEDISSEKYIQFDQAFCSLQKLRPRSYKVALLHYFLGYNVDDIGKQINREKSTVNAELATAKAYIFSQVYS